MSCAVSIAQMPCPAVAAQELSPAESAYYSGRYDQARDQYTQLLAGDRGDARISAGLVRTLLRQGEISQAATVASKALADAPQSAISLTAMAEVQFFQGQPWETLETLKAASAADPCYARIHLVRSRVMRIDSKYATERSEIQNAYDIDPNDPEIKNAFNNTVHVAHEIEDLSQSLKTTNDLTNETRLRANESIRAMMQLLSENNQTCQILPALTSVTIPLLPSVQDGKHVDGYHLDVGFSKGNAKLVVDTAASGLFISRAVADMNGLQQSADGLPGTVHADSVRIGPLEFRDCTVGVSKGPMPGNSDGYIGTDIFAQWLITLDQPASRLTLAPLPLQIGLLPGDRIMYPELSGYSPVYHRQQYLLEPVMLNNKSRQLFILDSGIRLSAMTPEVAHQVSATRINFTNSTQTVSGANLQIYRDNFDFRLANLSLNHQGHILALEPAAMHQNSGIQVAGMLGFDMLRSMVMHLDYRDGLVKLDTVDEATLLASNKAAAKATDQSAVECLKLDDSDRPVGSTLIAKVTGLIDSAHLKPGKEITIKVGNEWSSQECNLPSGSIIYGHITDVGAGNAGASDLGLNFDQAECDGKTKRAVSLKLIGMVASPDQYVGLHNALPSMIKGGGRDISVTAQNMGYFALDENLNPGGPPNTVHPGIVVGLPKMKLEPQGGRGCSAKITSTDHSVKLGAGAELILTMERSQ